jgi:hypothetical protein
VFEMTRHPCDWSARQGKGVLEMIPVGWPSV